MTEPCNQEHRFEVYEKRQEEIFGMVKDVHKVFYGVPGEDKGLLVEVDRNTGHRLWMSKWGWMVLSAVPAFVGGLAIWILTH